MKLAAVLLVLMGCQHDGRTDHAGSGGGTALGTERADCRADKTCDQGLLCLSNLCVRPPPADCQSVADQLASMDLGNYAEPEERAPVVAKYKATCESQYISKEEGVCLEKARDKYAAAACAQRLYPELVADCTQVGEKTRAAAKRQYRGGAADQYKMYIDAQADAARLTCAEDKWAPALIKCVLSADPNQGIFSYGSCQQQLGAELPKLQERFQKQLQQAQK